MTDPPPSGPLPDRALREFEKVAGGGWGGGVPLAELLDRANRVAAELLPEGGGRGSRAKRLYTERSFRHYQTLGCIDPPGKAGRRASYGFRHLVQGLLVRRLLWGRVPSGQIAALMAGRGTAEIGRMFLGGVEMVARAGGSERTSVSGTAESWVRAQVAPGVELHLRADLKRPEGAGLGELLARVEAALRRSL